MSALTGQTPGSTYKDLLQVSNSNSGIDATLRVIEDGEGTEGSFKLSTTGVELKNTATLSAATKSGSNIAILDMTNMQPRKNVTEVTSGATYTVLVTDHIIALNLSTSAVITVNLPAATGSGREIIVKDKKGISDNFTVTIDANGAETIDGSTTQTLTSRYASLTMIDDKSGEWIIV